MTAVWGYRDYTAKRRHTHLCDLCGEPIVVGDACKTWAYADGDRAGRVTVHAACDDEAKNYDWYTDEYWAIDYPLREEREEA